jgi:hypothetical protein
MMRKPPERASGRMILEMRPHRRLISLIPHRFIDKDAKLVSLVLAGIHRGVLVVFT